MRRRNTILASVGVVLILCIGLTLALNSHWFLPTAPRDVRLDLSGTEGLTVAGTYTADGVTHPVRGILPASFRANAKNFAYEVRIVDGQGEIKGQLFVNGSEAGMSSTSGRSVGIKGAVEFRDGLFPLQARFFTTLNEPDP